MIRVAWLKNNGLRIEHAYQRGLATRFVPAHGFVSVAEAAAALKIRRLKCYRLVAAKLIATQRRGGHTRIRVTELHRLRRDPAVQGDRRKLATG